MEIDRRKDINTGQPSSVYIGIYEVKEQDCGTCSLCHQSFVYSSIHSLPIPVFCFLKIQP